MNARTTLKAAWALAALALALPGLPAAAAEGTAVEQVRVPLSDPERPAFLETHMVQGCILVEARQDLKVVVVEVHRPDSVAPPMRDPASGMLRIPNPAAGFTVEEKANRVDLKTDSHLHQVAVRVLVPVDTSLKISCVNGGELQVRGVHGDLELSHTNGSISAREVAGSVVAHTVNGSVEVSFTDVDPEKAMSFATLNSDVEVSFPADLAADVRAQTKYGSISSDFEIRLEGGVTRMERREGGGPYRVWMDRAIRGTIGGGGPEMRFESLNGDIVIRRAGG